MRNPDLVAARTFARWIASPSSTATSFAARATKGGTGWTGDVTFDGRTHTGTMTLMSANAMRVVGCVAILCQSYELKRR